MMTAAEGKSPAGHVSGQLPTLSAGDRMTEAMAGLAEKISTANVTVMAIVRRAGVSAPMFYRALKGERQPSRWFIRRCERALASLVSGEGMPAEPGDDHLRAHYRAFLHQLGVALGVTEGELRSPAPRGLAAVARHGAWYLLSTEFAVRPARIADLFGVTRAAVTQALQATEDRRDDPAFDRALETIGARIMGRT